MIVETMIHTHRQTVKRYLLLAVVSSIVLMFFASQRTAGSPNRISPLSNNGTRKAEKWIVVTTINLPTQDVKKLANQPGWQLVVVGDKKTPKEWNLPNVVFLDIKTQLELGYKTLKYLPIGKYTRKAVGYLYAIQHGAKCIYETDDDNSPTHGLSGFKCDDAAGINLMMSSTNITENPYAHFGQSTIWPRGYPLDRVGLPVDYRYQVCSKATPTILQGVVNGDPDVDAVFRLTRRQPPMAFTLTFDSAAPPLILPPGTFAPFNSQNTFFLHRSLWAMILPVSVTDRATDIYRSYWAQRLQWLIGDTLAFLPPNAVQVRNLHSLLKDAQEEYELYQQMPRFVTVLNEWKCNGGDGKLFTCIKQLSRLLVKEGFWKQLDADLVEAWLEDLNSVGYDSPLLVEKSRTAFCEPDKDTPGTVRFRPVEQTTSMPHTSELHVPAGSTNHQLVCNAVGAECSTSHQLKWNSAVSSAKKDANFLLVVSVSVEAQSKLPLLVALHQLHYTNVIYCFQDKVSGDSTASQFIEKWRISVVWTTDEADAVSCLAAASKMEYGVRGFLYMTDRAFFPNSSSINILDRIESPVWIYNDQVTSQNNAGNQIKQETESSTLLDDIIQKLSSSQKLNAQEKERLTSCISRNGKSTDANKPRKISSGSEISLLYIPQKLMKRFWQLRNILTSQLDHLLAPVLHCDQVTTEALATGGRIASALLKSNIELDKPLCSYVPQII